MLTIPLHWNACTHAQTIVIMSVCLPPGAVSNGERPLMNDAAFDGFLKQVEQMHSQGKSIFETEFNVSV